MFHDAKQFGHVCNAYTRTRAISRPWIRVCVRASCFTFCVCKKRVHFISRFHELTFINTRTRAVIDRWSAIDHLALFIHLGSGFGKAAHVQQRQKTKHCVREMFEVIICVYVHFFWIYFVWI